MNSTEKLSEGILTERRLFPRNSDRVRRFQENPDRRVCKGNSEGQKGVSGGILRGRWGFFLGNPDPQEDNSLF